MQARLSLLLLLPLGLLFLYYRISIPETTPPPSVPVSTLAMAHLALLADIGSGPGPVVVGGIGDSGTRGTRDVLRLFGVHMLAKQFVNNGPSDSKLFTLNYAVTDPATGRGHFRNVQHLYVDAMRRHRSVVYNATSVPASDWAMGIELIAKMSWASLNTSRLMRREGELWGYKHPRTALVLPYLAATFTNKLRFVHVVRDPKEVIHGTNQLIFTDLCSTYYGHPCLETLDKRLEFWSDVNMDIYTVAKTQLSPREYLIVRTEDLVNGHLECFARLASFVQASPQRVRENMDIAVNRSMAHQSSYGGRSVHGAEKKALVAAVARAKSRIKQVMDLFGYSTDSWALSKACTELI